MALVLRNFDLNLGIDSSCGVQQGNGQYFYDAVRHAYRNMARRPFHGLANVESGAFELLEDDLAVLVETLAALGGDDAMRRSM